MCGRYTLIAELDELAEEFGLTDVGGLSLPLRYNIAPTQDVPVIRLVDGAKQLDSLRWGLIPAWAKDIEIGNKLINARSETAAEKPSFRSAFKKRRCLIPASGFYEWKKEKGGKQPYYIHRDDEHVLAFAGLWESWAGNEDSGPLETFTILTTDPNELMQTLHNRMPVILERDDYDKWLNSDETDKDAAQALLDPFPDGLLATAPVNKRVNSPRNDDAACLESPPKEDGEQGMLF